MLGNNSFRVVYLESVVKKDIPKLSASAKTTIKKAIEEKLIINPIEFGKPLQYTLKGYRRLRVGDYRVVFKIEEQEVLIVAIN